MGLFHNALIMSKIGYYRYKTFIPLSGSKIVTLYKNGIASGSALIKCLPSCVDFKILKYLDKDGQYRFFPFNQFWEQKDTPVKLGSVNKFVTSLLESQSNTENIGVKNLRTLSLTADGVTPEQLNLLSYIYTSPRVYILSNNSWIQVEIKGDGVGRPKKDKPVDVKIDVTLPESYTVKMI